MNFWLSLFLLLEIGCSQAVPKIEKISLPLIQDIQRADLYVLKLTEHPVAILVLSPGFNDNGMTWLQNPLWQKFAQDHNLGLVGLSFASDTKLLQKGHGYYYPSQGSGQLLIEGINQAFGRDIPLLLYGFSGGAHFTAAFAEWKPQQVKGWCAYSAGWWEKPSAISNSPPGIVACGDEDERYGASLSYFKQGRSLGKPWLWISLFKTGHILSLPLESFVRDYFAVLLRPKESTPSGRWMDIDLKTNADPDTVTHQPSMTGWLPDGKLLTKWKEIHQP